MSTLGWVATAAQLIGFIGLVDHGPMVAEALCRPGAARTTPRGLGLDQDPERSDHAPPAARPVHRIGVALRLLGQGALPFPSRRRSSSGIWRTDLSPSRRAAGAAVAARLPWARPTMASSVPGMRGARPAALETPPRRVVAAQRSGPLPGSKRRGELPALRLLIGYEGVVQVLVDLLVSPRGRAEGRADRAHRVVAGGGHRGREREGGWRLRPGLERRRCRRCSTSWPTGWARQGYLRYAYAGGAIGCRRLKILPLEM